MRGIYRIYCKHEDKSYIGKSDNIKERWKSHIYTLRNNKHINKHLQRVFNEYGENSLEFTILKQTNSYEENYYYESYYAEKYNVFNNGYNINKLYPSKDIKYIIDNFKIYENRFRIYLDKIKNNNGDSFNYNIELQYICDSFNITIEQAKIFINFFNYDGFNFIIHHYGKKKYCEIIYRSQDFIDKKLDNFYL